MEKAYPPSAVAVLCCSVLDQETSHFARETAHIKHVEMMPQGLHNDPPELRRQLQQAIDRLEQETEVEAIVLVYGLCSRGCEGLSTKRCRLVIARAHDCITHLLGCKDRYANYVREYPGTYWYSPGWNRHHTPPGPQRHQKLWEQYKQKYGEDNAEFLMESEQHWFQTYSRATYVHLTIGVTDSDIQYTRDCAHWLKWSFDLQEGDPALLKTLVQGPWDDRRFLVLEPGQTLRMTADERIMEAMDP